MTDFKIICRELSDLIAVWERILFSLPVDLIKERRNTQDRNIKQIVGHMVDSATNNTHRIIHLQYQDSPLNFPDYANLGINNRWISALDENISLESMVKDYPRHFRLHLDEITNLMDG